MTRGRRLMSLTDHLQELRARLIAVLIPWLLLVLAGFFLAEKWMGVLLEPLDHVVVLSPTEGFFTALRLSVYLGTAVATPLILYHGIAFITPGLKRHERRLLLVLLPVALLLFVAGVAVGYGLVLPLALNFFLNFVADGIEPMISLSRYISFVIGLVLPFGIVFEMPVAVFALARLGVIGSAGMRRNRKYVWLVLLILAAVLTPPDVLSQILLFLPMAVLYELSIWIAHLAGRPPQHADDENDDDNGASGAGAAGAASIDAAAKTGDDEEG